jgi:hypothetical protein
MRSCTLAVVTLRATPRADNIASNTTYCTIHLTTLQDATFQTGSTHATKTAPPAPREMVRPFYHGHSYQQLTVAVVMQTLTIRYLGSVSSLLALRNFPTGYVFLLFVYLVIEERRGNENYTNYSSIFYEIHTPEQSELEPRNQKCHHYSVKFCHAIFTSSQLR